VATKATREYILDFIFFGVKGLGFWLVHSLMFIKKHLSYLLEKYSFAYLIIYLSQIAKSISKKKSNKLEGKVL
jgi:hypothetical protein